MVNDNECIPLLKQYSFLGTREQYLKKLKFLSKLADKENWTSENSDFELDILYQYIMYTFERINDENKIIVSDDGNFSCFNTGLMTDKCKDIIGFFTKNGNAGKESWYLEGFYCEYDRRFAETFNKIPETARYFDQPELMYFNPDFNIIVNSSHILTDNKSRFSSDTISKGDDYLNIMFNGAFELAKKRIQRNYRMVVPQYYKKQITYLLPIDFDGSKYALAVELLNNKQYRANTILTLEMAYSNARLLMKPEADWLNIAK